MSGQSKYASLWECYYADVQAVVFVVDSADAAGFVGASAHSLSHSPSQHTHLQQNQRCVVC